jgi:putative tryptophan/tyrosine transport system substrate-binding protein
VQEHPDALLVGPDTLFRDRRVQLAMLSIRYTLPAIYSARESAEAGGLMSYAASFLKGARPTDLPILPASKFELVINLKTAKALGLEVPQTLLARADEVIE